MLNLGNIIDAGMSVLIICVKCKKPTGFDPEKWVGHRRIHRGTTLAVLQKRLRCRTCGKSHPLVKPSLKYDADGRILTDLAQFERQNFLELYEGTEL